MKKLTIFLIILFFIITKAEAQRVTTNRYDNWSFVKETAVSTGIGMGGNAAFGTDIQLMFAPRISAQIGAGINSFSGGINLHIYPNVNSSYFSLQIWQNGFGNKYKAAYIGPMFVYRASKILQTGLGIGRMIDKNPDIQLKSNYALMFNLGIYLPMQ